MLNNSVEIRNIKMYTVHFIFNIVVEKQDICPNTRRKVHMRDQFDDTWEVFSYILRTNEVS